MQKLTARAHGNHVLRIVVSILAVLCYAPIVVFAAVEFFGADELQRLFDWIIQRCPQCSTQHQLVVLIYAGVLALTLLALMFGLYTWVRRARRADRQVAEATHYFRMTPERVPPATVGVDPVEKRFYRDRQGRLRPMGEKE